MTNTRRNTNVQALLAILNFAQTVATVQSASYSYEDESYDTFSEDFETYKVLFGETEKGNAARDNMPLYAVPAKWLRNERNLVK